MSAHGILRRGYRLYGLKGSIASLFSFCGNSQTDYFLPIVYICIVWYNIYRQIAHTYTYGQVCTPAGARARTRMWIFSQAAAAIVTPTIIWVLTFKQESVIIYM